MIQERLYLIAIKILASSITLQDALEQFLSVSQNQDHIYGSALVLKGAALTQFLYRELGVRPYYDVDL